MLFRSQLVSNLGLTITVDSTETVRISGSGNINLNESLTFSSVNSGAKNSLDVGGDYALMFAIGSTASTTPTNLTTAGLIFPGHSSIVDVTVIFGDGSTASVISGSMMRRAPVSNSKGNLTLGTVVTVGTDSGTSGYAATMILDSNGYIVIQVTAPDTNSIGYVAKVEVYAL